MSRTRSAVLGAALAAATMGLAACGGSSKPSDSSGTLQGALADGGTFTFAAASDPGNLDPSMTPSSVARSVLGLSYDTLLYQRANGSFVSGLAEKWSATSTTATLTLRAGVTCSDGTPFTATQAADNITYIGDPKNASPLNGVFVREGTKVVANDAARTLTVTASSANGFLLNELSGIYMICRSGLDNHKTLANKTNGTGPWVLKSGVANDRYDFTPRKGYTWGPDGATLSGKGVPDAVRVRIIPSATTTANLLRDGSVNYGDVTGPDAARLNALGLKTLDNVDTSGETWFNEAAGRPGADPAVRKALILAADRENLGKIATGNNVQAATDYITLEPNPCAGTKPLAGRLPESDLAAAKTVLDTAGWKVGSDGIRAKGGKKLSIDFRYDAKGQTARTAGAEYLAAQWKKLGVDVDLKALPETQLNQLFFSTGAWDAAFANFTFNLPSQMVAFVSGTSIPNGANFPGIKNSDFDTAVKAATPQVGRAGCGDWAKAEQALLAANNPVVLYTSVNRTYLRKAQLTAPGGQIWGATLRLRTA